MALQQEFEQKLDIELTANRISGPFTVPPFEHFQISPMSLKEKSTPGKFRLIHNLSFPHDGSAINANIPASEKQVKFSNVTEAICIMSKLNKDSYTAKSDIKNAFGIIPIHLSDQNKLGFSLRQQLLLWENSTSGCWFKLPYF